jgi:RNA polymerase sigma-70 factor (ECF subfamily)
MQEAYVRAFQYLAKFEQRASFCTWITRIAVHEALARLEQRKRYALDMDEEGVNVTENLEAKNMNPEDCAVVGETRRLLERAILTLPYRYRIVIMLRDVEEMNTMEAAEALGLSEDVVKIRLHRARAMVRKELYARVGATNGSAFPFGAVRCDRVVAAVMERVRW